MKLPLVGIGGKPIGLYVEKPQNYQELMALISTIKETPVNDDPKFEYLMINQLKHIRKLRNSPLRSKRNSWIKRLNNELFDEIDQLIMNFETETWYYDLPEANK